MVHLGVFSAREARRKNFDMGKYKKTLGSTISSPMWRIARFDEVYFSARETHCVTAPNQTHCIYRYEA